MKSIGRWRIVELLPEASANVFNLRSKQVLNLAVATLLGLFVVFFGAYEWNSFMTQLGVLGDAGRNVLEIGAADSEQPASIASAASVRHGALFAVRAFFKRSPGACERVFACSS